MIHDKKLYLQSAKIFTDKKTKTTGYKTTYSNGLKFVTRTYLISENLNLVNIPSTIADVEEVTED